MPLRRMPSALDRPRRITVGPRCAPPVPGGAGRTAWARNRHLAASLGLAVGLLAVCPAAGVAGADAWHPEPAQDIQMKAVFTVVVCRARGP